MSLADAVSVLLDEQEHRRPRQSKHVASFAKDWDRANVFERKDGSFEVVVDHLYSSCHQTFSTKAEAITEAKKAIGA